MKKLIFPICISLFSSIYSCKEKDNTYTLTVLSGNNQVGEVNSTLPVEIEVQLLRGDAEIGYKSIKFETSTGQTITETTDAEGKARFTWSLNCGVGAQIANISALDPGQVLAKTVANAQSQIPASGYFKPCGLEANSSFYKFIFASSTGKLFTANQTLWASDDGGFNWYSVGGILPTNSMIQIGNALYGLTTGGIYRSTNDGISWNPFTPTIASALTKSSSHFIASTATGDIYASNDNGQNWYLAKGQSIATGIDFLFTNNNNQVIGLSENSAWTILQDSVIKLRTLNTNSFGLVVDNKCYFGNTGYVYLANDTSFSQAGIHWNFSSEISESRNMKNLHGNLYISQAHNIYQKGLSSPYYVNSNLTGRINDYYISPSGTLLVAHEGQGLFIKP